MTHIMRKRTTRNDSYFGVYRPSAWGWQLVAQFLDRNEALAFRDHCNSGQY